MNNLTIACRDRINTSSEEQQKICHLDKLNVDVWSVITQWCLPEETSDLMKSCLRGRIEFFLVPRGLIHRFWPLPQLTERRPGIFWNVNQGLVENHKSSGALSGFAEAYTREPRKELTYQAFLEEKGIIITSSPEFLGDEIAEKIVGNSWPILACVNRESKEVSVAFYRLQRDPTGPRVINVPKTIKFEEALAAERRQGKFLYVVEGSSKNNCASSTECEGFQKMWRVFCSRFNQLKINASAVLAFVTVGAILLTCAGICFALIFLNSIALKAIISLAAILETVILDFLWRRHVFLYSNIF